MHTQAAPRLPPAAAERDAPPVACTRPILRQRTRTAVMVVVATFAYLTATHAGIWSPAPACARRLQT